MSQSGRHSAAGTEEDDNLFPTPSPLQSPPTSPPQHQQGIVELLRYLEETRRRDELQRQVELEERRQEEERRERERREEEKRREEQRRQDREDKRQEDMQRREEDNQRFQALIQALSTSLNTTPTPSSNNSTSGTPPPVKPVVHTPPPLQADASFMMFREWRRRWEDYSTMSDLPKLPRPKQLIQLRVCLTLELQRILEHTLQVPPTTDKTVNEVLDVLQKHFKGLRNEVLRRKEFLSCKQFEGETCADFFIRLRRCAEEVPVCPGDPVTCEETQFKMIILMGLRDSDLVQKLLSLDPSLPLQSVMNACHAHEAARRTTSAINNPQQQVKAVSAYQKQKRQKNRDQQQDSPNNSSAATRLCYSCLSQHEPGQCPARSFTCTNCGKQGHKQQSVRCPAWKVQCRLCARAGHFEKCCRASSKKKNGGQMSKGRNSQRTGTTTCSSSRSRDAEVNDCNNVRSTATSDSPQLVHITVSCNGTVSRLHMLPDTGADVTIIGQRHLKDLGLPKSSLDPPLSTTTLTADGSEMSPALGTIRVTLALGEKKCKAVIQVHSNVQTPLLSYAHCRELAIISTQFPKPILKVKHANTLLSSMTPAAAKDYFLREFSDVLVSKEDLKSAPLRPMDGPPMKIYLKEGATPFAIHTPRQIPFAFRDQVKKELDSMVEQGIIQPVGDDPSEWCHPLVVVAKNNGVRITVDLSKLNKQVSRPAHPAPTPFAAVRSVDPKARYFSTADALCGYWQMQLAEEDQHLTTFITPYGRFKHCRGPMGFSATGDAYCLRGDIALQGVQRCIKVVDDILLHDEDYGSHLDRIRQVLTRCRQHGITLNKDKFVVAAPSVSFCGYTLSGDGIAADVTKTEAIRDFPTPANLTDLRSFMGLVNQLSEFTPDIAQAAQPLRPLMSPKRTFLWTPDHDEAFRRVKSALTSPPVLAPFDTSLPTYLQTDASRLNGIGYALLQDHGSGHLRLIQCGSRFLTDTETRYATIELEMLAVVWAMSKCNLYLQGLQHFTVTTDHRPLIPILNHYSLDAVENPRLQRLKEKTSPYIFTAVWCAGRLLKVPDALSRAPVSHPTPEDDLLSASTAAHLRAVVTVNTADEDLPQRDDRVLQELRDAAQEDPAYVRLRDCITSGFPAHRYNLHNSLLPYWKLRDDLSTDNGLVLYGARVVVPQALRRRTLARLHDSHRGAEATKRRARQAVFWPGINADITNTVSSCEACQKLQPSLQKEPLRNDDTPQRPFESISADYFSVAGKSFLVIADRLSGWPVVFPSHGDTTAHSTIKMFCKFFRDTGVPLRLRTDGGPQFASAEFKNFMERWGVHHLVTSPHNPRSNGHAEAAVKRVKHLILKTAPAGNIDCEEFARGLLELRNTPTPSGRSPAQVLYGHPLRSCVPAHPQAFSKEWQTSAEDYDRRAATRADQAQAAYDQHARPLPSLSVGQSVRIQDPTSLRWDKVGVVMSRGRSRDYEVRLPSGRVYWRNRRFLRPINHPGKDPLPHIPVAPCTDPETVSSAPPPAPRRSKRISDSARE